jgi:ABC-type enterochelin transport system permease subunit
LCSPPHPVSPSSSSLSDFLASLVDCSNFAIVKRIPFHSKNCVIAFSLLSIFFCLLRSAEVLPFTLPALFDVVKKVADMSTRLFLYY